MKRHLLLSAPLCAVLAFAACSEAEIPVYDVSSHRLYFTGEKEQTVTFQFYPGTDTYEACFPIQLIGQQLNADREVSVEVVDTATTALPDEYTLPTPVVFRKGLFTDTLKVLLKRSARMDDEEVSLALRIVANDHFDVGYPDSLMVKTHFSNLLRKPEWWTEDITNAIFGPYSDAKYHYLIESTGIADYSGYSLTEMRKVRDAYQQALDAHPEWTEADGSPIELAGY